MNKTLNHHSILLYLALIFTSTFIGQNYENVTFAAPSKNEISDYSYPKDPEAAAVILYEKGETKVKVINDYLRLVTVVHRKIKVLDAKAYGDAIVEIDFYAPDRGGEKVTHVRALTHNGAMQQYVSENDFFVKDSGGPWKRFSFTFPNLEDQSLLEYTYTIESPYFQTFNWYFQEEYPKIYSEYISEIPGNYEYSIGFRGFLKFDFHDPHIKKSCFSIQGMGKAADCYYNKYIMKDIPAFEEEEYMLSKHNYLSQLRYELKQSTSIRGERAFYTKRWQDVDDEFRYDKEMGRQLNNKSYFRKNLSEQLYAITDPLEKAKAIYYAIQKHYTWNGNYRLFNDIDVRDAFERGTGNIAEINLTLINVLQEAGLEAYISLSATRDNSIPTELYPVMTEFNYVMAYLKIGNSFYFLDATNKYTPFGVLPFRALNYRARIMDFKEGSYWQSIIPFEKNQHYINARLSFNDAPELIGQVQEVNSGYFSQRVRENKSSMKEEDYLESKGTYLVWEDYEIENEGNLEKPLKETYSIKKEFSPIDGDTTADSGNIGDYYVNPFFLLKYLSENPFQMDAREYPVDFGYPINFTYLMALDLGANFKVKHAPESRTFKLPENLGNCQVMYQVTDNSINIRFQLRQNKVHLGSEYYLALKNFYAEAVKLIAKDILVLTRT